MENSNMNLSYAIFDLRAAASGVDRHFLVFQHYPRPRSASAKMSNNITAAAAVDGAGGGAGPINKKGQFRGVMFEYGPQSIQVREMKILDKLCNLGCF